MKGMEREQNGASGFLWVGNHPCLDFVNTEAMMQGTRVDLLPDAGALVAWLERAGLLTAEQASALTSRWRERPDEGEATLRRTRAFRAVIRRMADELADSGAASEASVAAINDALKERVGYWQVWQKEDGTYAEGFEAFASLPDVVGLLAGNASDLLCHADPSLIRRCENPRCILYFYDTTKNHARRWCSMGACGNRAKAAAHYRRVASHR
jgi:predicted RNA-binding Zn ribbon-like protein